MTTEIDDEFINIQKKLNQKYANQMLIFWINEIPKSNNLDLKTKLLKALFSQFDEDYEISKKLYEELLKVPKISNVEKMALNLNLGNSYYLSNQPKLAIENYNKVLEIFEKQIEK